VPAVGFWTFILLVLSIIQIPPLLTLLPILIYVLSTAGFFGSAVFIVCGIVVVLVDTLLKPVLLGRTADAPMLIVLLGAIGGMMLWGIAGLFVGAVLLVLGWGGLEFWIMKDDAPVGKNR
jgi:predicted PurR-regulated permease PerM